MAALFTEPALWIATPWLISFAALAVRLIWAFGRRNGQGGLWPGES